eukprot:TRINITY_DN1876_c0_g2_i1.p1 TRINITY_DN1876_c0_g2~~TRINITY_DN1876_c0_g2_i1.p1  ORF type:complete len:655 (+),score=263.25 TRINITY_DN1876_c0_g2_i1:71-2035(+)
MPRAAEGGGDLARLPAEILQAVWAHDCVGPAELCALAATCKRLRAFTDGCAAMWKAKLEERWPRLRGAPAPRMPSGKAEYVARHVAERRVNGCLAGLAEKYYTKEDVDGDAADALTDPWAGDGRDLAYLPPERTQEYVVSELSKAVHDAAPTRSLTGQYYAKKALRTVRHAALKGDVARYLQRKDTGAYQDLEAAAALVAQWCQPYLSVSPAAIAEELDELADLTRAKLQGACPGHPAAAARARPPLLTDEEGAAVLDALNAVLYRDLRFAGNQSDYYNAANSMLNRVLEAKKGIPITLSVIYASVARRLGVVCEAVNFPGHFLLIWQRGAPQHVDPDAAMSGSDEDDAAAAGAAAADADPAVLIDAFNNGVRMTKADCLSRFSVGAMVNSEVFQPVPGELVLLRMVRNLVVISQQHSQEDIPFMRSVYELGLLASRAPPVEDRVMLCRIYIHTQTNLAQARQLLASLEAQVPTRLGLGAELARMKAKVEELEKEEEARPAPKRRDGDHADVEFAVGQVMYHKRYHYTCIVYGWDPECKASWQWILQMGVNNLPKQHHQPFYNVLCNDGSTRYAAQESLAPAPDPKPVPHPEVGRYFDRYCGAYYTHNAQKRREYPDDEAFIAAWAEAHPYIADPDAAAAAAGAEEEVSGLPAQ